MTYFPQSFITLSCKEMEVRPDTIRAWAKQTEDQELAELANKVIEAAGSVGE